MQSNSLILQGQITRVIPHPNADKLNIIWVKKKDADISAEHLITTNDQNLAEDDSVLIALPGAILKDGTTIKAARIQGINSYGCLIKEADIPQDQTNIFNFKWQKIRALEDVLPDLNQEYQLGHIPNPIKYQGKPKLDGTNGCIKVLTTGEVEAYSRRGKLSLENTNHGFYDYVNKHKKKFAAIAGDSDIYIYGEWCGPRINKGTAITLIPQPIFAVFAIVLDGKLLASPSTIEDLLTGLDESIDLYILPWSTKEIYLYLDNPEWVQNKIDYLNSKITTLAKEDPWIKSVFDISGSGEGIVLYPRNINNAQHYLIKAKSVKHQTRKTKAPMVLSVEQVKDLQDLIAKTVTTPRLNQAVRESCQGDLYKTKVGVFITWMISDILAEEEPLISGLNLSDKIIKTEIANASRDWFLAACKVQNSIF